MRQTKSFKNVKNKEKGNFKNLEIFNALSFRQKDNEIPKHKSNGKNNIKNNMKNKNKSQPNLIKEDKIKNKRKKNLNNSSPSEKENNQINIRLNINSEIINNNYSKKENKQYKEIIKKKNALISSLEKELFEIKEKINKCQNKKKRINSVDYIEEKNINKKIINNNNKEEINKIHSIKPSNIISKNMKQLFKNLILKKESFIRENISTKNSSKKNLILNTSNLNNYVKYKHKKNLSSKNLYSHPTREIEITEKNNLLTHTRKSSSSLIKSNSFLFTSNNLNNKRKKINKRTQSNFLNINNKRKSGNNIFIELDMLKQRTNDLLINFLNICDDKFKK